MLSLLLVPLLAFHYIQVPVASMREMPSEDSPILSQAIFAEEVNPLESTENWIKIQTLLDDISGWIPNHQVHTREEEYAPCSCVMPIVEIRQISAQLYELQQQNYTPLVTLPFETRLEADPFFLQNETWIKVKLPNNRPAYIQKEDVTFEIQPLKKEELIAFSKMFLNIPFTSGGRSSFGFDDSGYTQMLFRHMGFFLPRTLQHQMDWEGFEEVSLDTLETGDLLFWGQTPNIPSHVGIYLENGQFIHAEPSTCITLGILTDESALWPFCTARRLK